MRAFLERHGLTVLTASPATAPLGMRAYGDDVAHRYRADNECRHGRLASDPGPSCPCWR